jgi:hypothetical protein
MDQPRKMPPSSSAMMNGVVAAVFGVLAVGCAKPHDQDIDRRPVWVHEQTVANNLWVREILTRPDKNEFYDGWYPVEFDPKTGGAWRWMEKRGIIRLRTRIDGAPAIDMQMKLFGWVPHEHVGLRVIQMELMANGHVLERFDPPKGTFEHSVIVPKWLLSQSEYIDFTITVTNTGRPGGDWRDLGFATTGFHWTPAGGS